MKNDLLTSIALAIFGILASYFVCNLFTGEISPATVKTVSGSASASLADPNPNVFNYNAINPTVEVYIGDDTCTEHDSSGNCIVQRNQNAPETPSDQRNR